MVRKAAGSMNRLKLPRPTWKRSRNVGNESVKMLRRCARLSAINPNIVHCLSGAEAAYAPFIASPFIFDVGAQPVYPYLRRRGFRAG
jgi:hypothetical protein